MEYPFGARHGDSHSIEGGLLLPKFLCQCFVGFSLQRPLLEIMHVTCGKPNKKTLHRQISKPLVIYLQVNRLRTRH